MKNTPTTVLLVGHSAARSAMLQQWLSDRGCHCQFAASFDDACRLMTEREFDLVLCQYELADRTAFPLLDWLEGSHSTLLFTPRSGNGSRWLPVIERGKRCIDRPLLKATNLANALQEMLDGHSDSDSRGYDVSSESLEQVGAM
jgi:CheY-like chemotaxis protein